MGGQRRGQQEGRRVRGQGSSRATPPAAAWTAPDCSTQTLSGGRAALAAPLTGVSPVGWARCVGT
eukprot:309099-Alexandrium_andersonii.AAC.1